MIWFRWVLWHINHCWLFNAKSSLYIYIRYTWFNFVGFYGISTIVGYLMPNPFYTYILDIYDLVGLGWVGFYGISTIVGYLIPNLPQVRIGNRSYMLKGAKKITYEGTEMSSDKWTQDLRSHAHNPRESNCLSKWRRKRKETNKEKDWMNKERRQKEKRMTTIEKKDRKEKMNNEERN